MLDERLTDTTFESQRGRLFGIAYRMLGSRAEAEDIVQDTYLRWHQADRPSIDNPQAWLVTAATRRAIDRLRALAAERAAYQGAWLPEPLMRETPPPDSNVDRSSDLSIAFLALLERLAPEERAAFLLHEVFDCDYRLIAGLLEKSEAACRQIVHRARDRVTSGRKRFAASEAAKIRLLKTFTAAAEARDEGALLALFAPDATWTADGGGRVPASPRPIVGAARIAKLVVGLMKHFYDGTVFELVEVNGEAGLGVRVRGQLISVMSIETDGSQIFSAWLVVNPDKLGARPPD